MAETDIQILLKQQLARSAPDVVNLRVQSMDSSWLGILFPDVELSASAPEGLDRLVDYLDERLKNVQQANGEDISQHDLRAYMPWLFERIVPSDSSEVPLTREDEGRRIDDLALFDRLRERQNFVDSVRGQFPGIADPWDISHYKNLETLDAALKPFRHSRPLSPLERAEADKFLGTDAMQVFTSKDWPQAGYRLVRIDSYEAAMAYGRHTAWPTSHRHSATWFNKYHDGLIVLENAQGERYQLHFSTMQFRNAENGDVSLIDLDNRHPQLLNKLYPFYRSAVVHLLSGGHEERAQSLITQSTQYGWRPNLARENLPHLTLARIARNDGRWLAGHLLRVFAANAQIAEQVNVRDIAFLLQRSVDMKDALTIVQIFEPVSAVPKWENGIPAQLGLEAMAMLRADPDNGYVQGKVNALAFQLRRMEENFRKKTAGNGGSLLRSIASVITLA